MQKLNMNGGPYLLCVKPGCCAGTKYELVEDRLLQHLREILDELTSAKSTLPKTSHEADYKEMLATVRREQKAAEGQKSRLYELLELGEYDLPTFRERMPVVKEKLARLEAKEKEILSAMDRDRQIDPQAQARKIAAVLDAYDSADIPQRNALLHSVIDHAEYTKAKKTKPTDFTLQTFLKPN